MPRAKVPFLTIAVLLCLLVILVHYIPKPSPGNLPFSQSHAPIHVLSSLQWYSEHSLGSLAPPFVHVLAFSPEDNNPSSPGAELGPLAYLPQVVFSQELLKRYLFYPTAEKFSRGRRSNIRLAPQFRSHLWWPGASVGTNILLYSPYMYEVIEIERIVLERVEHLDQIRVEFRWKIKGLSLAQQLVNDLGMEIRTKNPPGAKVQQSEERQKLIGAELKHSVIMQKSKYGYFLPLRGEPHWTAPLGDTAEASAKQSIDERG